MTMPEDMKDLNAAADKLLKDKIDNAAPIAIADCENFCNEVIHLIDLPTIVEVYKEVGLQILKYAVGIGLFLAGWWLLSNILDGVAMVMGY